MDVKPKIFFFLFILFFFFLKLSSAQDQPTAVEVNGDIVEYSVEENKVTAKGNVVIYYKDVTLTCDKVEFFRNAQTAYAEGHVHLTQGIAEMLGEKLVFNFGTMMGDFEEASIISKPYYGKGAKLSKVAENEIIMKDGYITTCDVDKPHFHLFSPKIDVYPQDKLIAKNVRMVVGKLPILFIPRYTQDLRDKEPRVVLTPGYDKKWGMFLLQDWYYRLNDNIKGIIQLDAREKKDLAGGVDVKYKIPSRGDGIIRTYYMNERSITSKHFYQERPSPTIERERFRVEWRHKWEIDQKTSAILQYYRMSDNTILKEYFEREFDQDISPKTYFLFTRVLPGGTLNFLTEARVNRFESAVERLPELRYDMTNTEIADSGFFFRNKTTYTNLTTRVPSPSEARDKTMRVDADNELSYPMKIGIIEMRPFVGGEHTYYSRTKERSEYNSIRGIFRTGASLSTKFYKIFDYETEKWGFNIHRLRHLITPSVSYEYNHGPTIPSSKLLSFDGIDTKDIGHSITFGLENKLQTKRDREIVDLLRFLWSTDFRLKEHPGTGGFDAIRIDIDFKPQDRVTFYFDSSYDTRKDYLTAANFDLYINGGEKWSADIGKRWSREVDDQLTTGFFYRLNPKWALRTYSRFDLRNGILKEQEYTVSRDLHCWVMDLNFNETRRQGTEIWLVFTLKEFPEMKLDLGTSFNKRKAGSQSQEGE